jgi:hypothetical protein
MAGMSASRGLAANPATPLEVLRRLLAVPEALVELAWRLDPLQ